MYKNDCKKKEQLNRRSFFMSSFTFALVYDKFSSLLIVLTFVPEILSVLYFVTTSCIWI